VARIYFSSSSKLARFARSPVALLLGKEAEEASELALGSVEGVVVGAARGANLSRVEEPRKGDYLAIAILLVQLEQNRENAVEHSTAPWQTK